MFHSGSYTDRQSGLSCSTTLCIEATFDRTISTKLEALLHILTGLRRCNNATKCWVWLWVLPSCFSANTEFVCSLASPILLLQTLSCKSIPVYSFVHILCFTAFRFIHLYVFCVSPPSGLFICTYSVFHRLPVYSFVGILCFTAFLFIHLYVFCVSPPSCLFIFMYSVFHRLPVSPSYTVIIYLLC